MWLCLTPFRGIFDAKYAKILDRLHHGNFIFLNKINKYSKST